VPALPSSNLEPLWVQLAAPLPTRQVHHPLGCHRPRIADRVVFDKLIQVLAERAMVGQIATRGVPAPVQASRRWPVERTHAWGDQ
jgi:hypothetical protein